MTEQALQELLRLIRGDGPYRLFGGGLTTYPGADAGQQAIYEGTRELECRGLIRRQWEHVETQGLVVYFEAARHEPMVLVTRSAMIVHVGRGVRECSVRTPDLTCPCGQYEIHWLPPPRSSIRYLWGRWCMEDLVEEMPDLESDAW